MKQVAQHNKSGEIQLLDVPIPALKSGHVLVRTRFSVISTGTEKASVTKRKSSLMSKARANPDLVLKVLEQVKQYGLLKTVQRVQSKLESYSALGYSVSGIVLAAGPGVSDLVPGDNVACAGAGYASHAEFLVVPRKLCAKVPDEVALDDAAYSTLGAIALQGVRQAAPTLGESIVVIGLGLLGQITVQILKASGCQVIGIDLDQDAISLAKSSGADLALHRKNDDVKGIVRAFTKGFGADAVVITAASRSNDPVELAGELCRDRGRVVLVGDVTIEIPRTPYFLKELEFKLSRSIGPGRYDATYEEMGNDYPIGYVRWTENRNLQEFLRLLAAGRIDLKKLTTHRFEIAKVKSAYELLSGKLRKERFVGIILDYGDFSLDEMEKLSYKVEMPPEQMQRLPVATKIGFIGAGNFAQASLLPHLRHKSRVSLIGVCNANGLTATNVAQGCGFRYATTDPKTVIEDENVKAVFIATRHNLHARYTIDALKAGKHVFVEKPLALNEQELKHIQDAYLSSSQTPQAPLVMVGFNRRFAPHVRQVKRFFEHIVGPYVIQYRINAGFIPSTHWTRDPVEGGGRIIGEVCHFIDLMQFFTGAYPIKIFAEALLPEKGGVLDDDSVLITLKFADGSIGTISYMANGDSSLPKERIEISSTGRSAIIENFQVLSLFQKGKRRDFKLKTIDKGHRDEIFAFLQAIENGAPSPISMESLFRTTLSTFKVIESLQSGVPVTLA
ncbi:MAG: bi-domain-containing oxidoreductase [bacterium]